MRYVNVYKLRGLDDFGENGGNGENGGGWAPPAKIGRGRRSRRGTYFVIFRRLYWEMALYMAQAQERSPQVTLVNPSSTAERAKPDAGIHMGINGTQFKTPHHPEGKHWPLLRNAYLVGSWGGKPPGSTQDALQGSLV